MFFSYNWLQTFFVTPLPEPAEVAEALTRHSSEVDEVTAVGDDTVFDVSVLPDRSAWLACHRGMAKELSVILDQPLKADPLALEAILPKLTERVVVDITTPTCDYYSATLIEGITVEPSPAWLQTALTTIGQRPVNNIVDITNYVLFHLGQPLHAFAAEQIPAVDGRHKITVRAAEVEESFESLTGDTYTLTINDAVITNGHSGEVLALAGVKGGKNSGIDSTTTSIILEAAHFDRKAVRKTAQSHKLITDASRRYENGVDRAMSQYGLALATQLITEIAGGQVVGRQEEGDATIVRRAPVSVSLAKINSVLGLSLSATETQAIMRRFGYIYTLESDVLTVTPPFERDDLVIAEDVIEEIGRIQGLDSIVSIPPIPQAVSEYNSRHVYADKIRDILTKLGWSEVYTSTFRAKDIVRLENALASDKGYLRSSLTENLKEARERNVPHRDLLGLQAVQLFEIGTVFPNETEEEFRVALAVQTGTSYKAKHDEPRVVAALEAIATELGQTPELLYNQDGVVEFSLDTLLATLPPATQYQPVAMISSATYTPFSVYPPVSRDIALWVGEGTGADEVESVLRAAAPTDLLARLTHLDTFTKDGRTSLAFRFVFQSSARTLVEKEIVESMNNIYTKVQEEGWEVR